MNPDSIRALEPRQGRGLVPQDRALLLLTTTARPKRHLLPPSPALGNLWPRAGSKKQLHIVLECLPDEKIITFSNCSVGGPGPVSDKGAQLA